MVEPTIPTEKNKPFKPWSKPFLRWAGSKRKLVPYLVDYIPDDYGRYFEPFTGSSCLFFAIKPKEAILGDINEELIHTYSIVKTHPRLVARKAKSFPNTAEDYLAIRNIHPLKLSPIDRAARFIYLNRFCFNGVYRTNKKGMFNVPRGSRTGSIPNESFFYRCSTALKSAKLIAGDFNECLKNVKKNDFVYLDPPYTTTRKNTAGEYGPVSFKCYDIPRLLNCLYDIHDKGAFFLLSYNDSEELINSLSPSWRIDYIDVSRHIAGFSKYRKIVREIIVTNIMSNI